MCLKTDFFPLNIQIGLVSYLDTFSMLKPQPRKRKLCSFAKSGELYSFLYYSQVYLRLLPNQLMEQQNSLNVCGSCYEMGALGLFAL